MRHKFGPHQALVPADLRRSIVPKHLRGRPASFACVLPPRIAAPGHRAPRCHRAHQDTNMFLAREGINRLVSCPHESEVRRRPPCDGRCSSQRLWQASMIVEKTCQVADCTLRVNMSAMTHHMPQPPSASARGQCAAGNALYAVPMRHLPPTQRRRLLKSWCPKEQGP